MYFKQVKEIAERRKHCTQRVEKPGEQAHYDAVGAIDYVRDANGRLKWHVGGVYAVSPGRGQRTAMVQWLPNGSVLDVALPKDERQTTHYQRSFYRFLRIQVCQIERVRLQTMDERVAIAEEVESLDEYIALWRSINERPGTRWEDNPLVWRLWFELAKGAA